MTTPDPLLTLPEPDAIRAAIDQADERARLLRRLLLVAVRLRLHLVTGDTLASPIKPKGGIPRVPRDLQKDADGTEGGRRHG